MATEKTPNYSAAQEKLISDLAAEKGTLNLDDAKALAANPLMNTESGDPRNYRSIVAKISRMGVSYARKVPTTKDGRPVTKKTDLVARIAALAGIQAAKLDGMDKSPKGALEAVVSALESREADEAETGTEG